MAVYSVHTQGEDPTQIADAAFVREGFSRGAFALGPLWLARHRLWLAALVWTALWLLLILATAFNLLSALPALAAFLLLQGLLGLEAAHLLEMKLARRQFRLVDVVATPALEQAQSVFFRRRAASPDAGPHP